MTFQILAHRGASHAERENTVDAFRRARAMGADGVELDVRWTADQILVVHHDPLLDDGRMIVETGWDAMPTHVPTLAQALDACEGMWVNLEIKNDPSEADFDPDDGVAVATMAHLAERGEPQRWLISSFRLETIDRCHEIDPAIRTAWLVSVVPDDVVEILVARGHSALHPWVGLLDRGVIDACHVGGIEVNTWTCDDPLVMETLIGWGIDGICTNVPDVALAVRGGAAQA